MADDNVVPFRRRADGPAAEPSPDPDHPHLHSRLRRATPEARALAAAQNAEHRQRYTTAAIRQANDRLVASGRPVPARITLALDLRELYGPEVDVACDTEEGRPAAEGGDVDQWELALAVPTAEQVELLAELTGFPVAFFYMPLPPGPLVGPGPVWMCGPSRCEAVEPDYVDEDGVLHYGGEPKRTLRPHVQGELPVPAERVDPPPRPAPVRKKQAPPKTSSRMPDHLRAELEATLEAAKNRRK